MKKICFNLIFLLNISITFSQTLTDVVLSKIPIDKDTVFFVELYNDSENPIYINNIELIDSSNCFTLLNVNKKFLEKNENYLIQVKFKPKDNINYNAYLKCEIITNISQYTLISKIEAKATHPIELYKKTDNLKGRALLTQLRSYVEPHTVLSYKAAREFMWGTLDNIDGFVECIYTGRKVKTSGIPDVNTTKFNTEHTWPQAYGAENEPPKSDLYHIRPSYEIANSKRANYPFGFVKGNVMYEDGGSKLGLNQNGEIVFEPRPSVCGDIARGMFYFALKYNNPYGYINSQLKDLREFSLIDPVDSTELIRNYKISEVQKNINPFIVNNNFIFRINNFENPDFIPLSYPIVSSNAIYLLNQNNAYAYFYIINFGDDTLYISNYSFNQYNNGQSFSFKLDKNLNEIKIYPFEYKKIKVFIVASEPVAEWFEGNLNLFFSNGKLIPISFKVKSSFTGIKEVENNYIINQNDNYLSINFTSSLIYNIVLHTIEGKSFDFSKYINNSTVNIPKEHLPCRNCLLFLELNNNILKKIIVN